MDGPDRRHPGDVDTALRAAVPVWAGPMARVVAIALLSVDPAPGGAGDRRYEITTRVGLDEPETWLVVARWLSGKAVAQLSREKRADGVGLAPLESELDLDLDIEGHRWVVFLELHEAI